MKVWAWIRRALGLDDPVSPRLDALERRVVHNDGALEGAIKAFEQFAGVGKRD